jgi:uncharacterized protein YdeI (YjbR/CyaY-like superfamily)
VADTVDLGRPFADAAAWAQWLEENAGSSAGIWVQLAKKGAARSVTPGALRSVTLGELRSVTYDEALEVALCFGWIDGQKRSLDETWWLQRFTPRRPTSRWSQRNRTIAERLIEQGRMLPGGQAEVDRARADGRWEAAYAGARTMTVPPDLQAALDVDPTVAEAFAGLDGANRYAILYRLQDAKKPETRARRLAGFVVMLREGRTIHPRRT